MVVVVGEGTTRRGTHRPSACARPRRLQLAEKERNPSHILPLSGLLSDFTGRSGFHDFPSCPRLPFAGRSEESFSAKSFGGGRSRKGGENREEGLIVASLVFEVSSRE